jgi:tRNA pseudouridine38-40 synthase
LPRFKAIVQYYGTPFVGFQIQKNGLSVQEALEKALKLMSKGHVIPVVGSGRTDSGVHALGQVIHFDYPGEIREDAVLRAMNSILDDAIRVISVERVEDDFHARFHTNGKQYIYKVDTSRFPSPFTRQFMYHHPYKTDVSRMQQALQSVIGIHDFQSFCSTKTDKTNFVREIYRAEVTADPDAETLTFLFEGSGFLYNMVRILVGTSLQIGDGLRPVTEMQRLLEVKDRNEAGPTAAAHGLYLNKVYYLSPEERRSVNEAYLAYKAGLAETQDNFLADDAEDE